MLFHALGYPVREGKKEREIYCPSRTYGVGAQQSWLQNFITLFRTLDLIMGDTNYNLINETLSNDNS